MHEGNFTSQIVTAILDELKNYPGARPAVIRVKVGEMLHLLPESVRMHYAVLTRGSALEGSRLILEEVPVKVRCRNCGAAGGVEDHHLLMCAACQSRDVELVEGGGVEIQDVEIAC